MTVLEIATYEFPIKGLSADDIAKDLANGVASLAIESSPSEWCHSILFPQAYFEREVIETVEVVGGIRRVTVPFELVKINFNVLDLPPLAYEVRRLLRLKMLPLLEGSGRFIKETPEGLVIMLSEDGQIG